MKVWEWIKGRLICSEQVGEVREEEGEGEGEAIEAIIKTCCSSCTDSPLIVAALEKLVGPLKKTLFSRCNHLHSGYFLNRSSRLAGFLLSPDGSLSLWGRIQLAGVPRDVTFLQGRYLWACLANTPSQPMACYRWKKNEVIGNCYVLDLITLVD